MGRYGDALEWLDSQADQMAELVKVWGNLNTGTFNPLGLEEFAKILSRTLSELADDVQIVPAAPFEQIDVVGKSVPVHLGPNVVAVKRDSAAKRVLLAIHMDTVYGLESSFQKVERTDAVTLRGPGVADAKGGIVVLLFALRAFERFVEANSQYDVGWDVILNSDEEIGSPGSTALFAAAAKRVQLGMLYEPSLPHGGLISTRKGSGNFAIVIHGVPAHAGRDFHLGRNAIIASSRVAVELNALNGQLPDLTLNVARIDGGAANNVVPDLGIVRFNIRYGQQQHEEEIRESIERIMTGISSELGVQMKLDGLFRAPPKLMTPELERMLKRFHTCGKNLGMELNWTSSGGVCDGNRLAAYGIPNVDTLGVRGGNIHSSEEFVLLESLVERAKLSALFLMKLADGEYD
ncbi:hydrolase [Planctomicrobium sp. SH527]|uniref:hydrolase n=1 Tax=Planctomicrobium sp. SH527 TaxID=3448123 RepID=UPI003F5C3D57